MTSYMRPIVALLCAGALEASGVVAHAEAEPTTIDAPASAQLSRGLTVHKVRVDGTGDGRRVIISLNREPSGVRKFALSDPPRVVVDLDGPLDGVGDEFTVGGQGLHDLGWVEGRTITVENRYAYGKLEQLPGLVADLVRLKVDLIVAVSPQPVQAARDATTKRSG